MQKETYELFQKKFLKECSPEELQFLREIEGYRNIHTEKAKVNKKKYFNNNLLLISLLSGNKVLKIFLSILVTILPAVGITRIIEICLEVFNITVSNEMSLIIIVCIGFLTFAICIYALFVLEKIQKELPFRRYGETWVRHTVALADYEEEILKYTYNLEDYKGKNAKEQREIFMVKAIAIESKNMDKFEKNMKEIQ